VTKIDNSQETITVNKRYYEELVRDARKLALLEANGVDNWDGYECIFEDDDEDSE